MGAGESRGEQENAHRNSAEVRSERREVREDTGEVGGAPSLTKIGSEYRLMVFNHLFLQTAILQSHRDG